MEQMVFLVAEVAPHGETLYLAAQLLVVMAVLELLAAAAVQRIVLVLDLGKVV
jgi:hypothetical protein